LGGALPVYLDRITVWGTGPDTAVLAVRGGSATEIEPLTSHLVSELRALGLDVDVDPAGVVTVRTIT
jgi:hypothetical protein